jgi:D-glycero-D-manno-heptose 1,7-bisphosphate phosphatase
MAVKNALIDRDGTIIVEKHYLCDPAQVELTPGAAEALARLSAAGVRLFVVTNQSGIGRGYYAEADFCAVQERLAALLAPRGVVFTAVAFCPHAPDACCDCRKPATGMWEELRDAHGLDPAETAMIGDNASDVAFGRAAGLAESILVLTGHGARFADKLGLPPLTGGFMRLSPAGPESPTILARDLASAADCLLRGSPGDAP